jgi:hypothetical protein
VWDPNWKLNWSKKKGWGISQVLKCMLRKCKALNSNSSTTNQSWNKYTNNSNCHILGPCQWTFFWFSANKQIKEGSFCHHNRCIWGTLLEELLEFELSILCFLGRCSILSSVILLWLFLSYGLMFMPWPQSSYLHFPP